MKFDFTHTLTQPDGRKLAYGRINGNSRIVIIKAGAGGTCRGDGDKYIRMAKMLHDHSGCTVICFSNFSNDSFERADMDVIRELVSKMAGEARLYYIGVSNGATQGLLDATRYFAFVRILLINMPLMINFHKIKAALGRVNSDIRFVYGEKDPSYSYVPFLTNVAQKDTCTAHVEIVTVSQADHNFEGMLDTFLDLGMGVLTS